MIILRAIRSDEFSGFCDYFINDYANEIANNYGHTLENSLLQAKQSLLQSFPEDEIPQSVHLLCIETSDIYDSKHVGYLWYSENSAEQSVFINDFYIFDQFRSLGYGRAAMVKLEQRMLESGLKQIKLRVAYDNKRALALYEEIGFSVTGINMAKSI
ncbi:MAG: GNAT family N-acetyltransferase [Aliivibrio sp.]|uniref:GNAT family N-acetyltransferase n=1 Tax=Aliivibrio sp. TaxID=1872443 RepID=UPI001A635A9A|nr:GNAT family N-acetyltransferase [Aliivibrio sp.]